VAALVITDLGGGDIVVQVISDATWRSIETTFRAHQRGWRAGRALELAEPIIEAQGVIAEWHLQAGVMESDIVDPRKHTIANLLYLKP
jgi:hypothetical protein